MNHTLVVRGGLIVDGTGAEPRVGDVVARDGRLVEVGGNAERYADALELAADGLVVAPGFVDIHTHSDLRILDTPSADSKVLQGVTTEVVGNCGFSAFPAEERPDGAVSELLRTISERAPRSWDSGTSYAEAVRAARPAVNVASLVGHGTLRAATMGLDDRAPTADELAAMRSLLAGALQQGAVGLSTGLTYAPSGFARPAEVHALAEVVADHGALYATHARANAAHPEDAYREAFDVGRATGARVQYSHIAINDPRRWGRAAAVLELFDGALDEGLDVAFDVYPYDASASALTQYLPAWARDGGLEAMRERLSDGPTRRLAEAELAGGFYGGIPWRWDRVMVAAGHERPGATLEALANEGGVSPEALVLELCLERGNDVQVVLFYRREDDVRSFLEHPLAVVGSDGDAHALAGDGLPHPRSFGTYPRVLGRCVREGRLELAAAVRKMTAAAAERVGLADRGRLEPGLAADLVIFDAATVEDRATYLEPRQAPSGIRHVVVNGELVVKDGGHTGARPGAVLRREGSC